MEDLTVNYSHDYFIEHSESYEKLLDSPLALAQKTVGANKSQRTQLGKSQIANRSKVV